MDTAFLGPITGTDSALCKAGREACIDLGLPISDAAFTLIDTAAEYVAERISEWPAEDLHRALDEITRDIGNWWGGAGIISVYTADHVRLWADLSAWMADVSVAGVSEDHYREQTPEDTVSDLIGWELSIIAETIGRYVAEAAVELAFDAADA